METLNNLQKQRGVLVKQIAAVDSERRGKMEKIAELRSGPFSGGPAAYALDTEYRELVEQRLILASELQCVDLQIVNMQSSG